MIYVYPCRIYSFFTVCNCTITVLYIIYKHRPCPAHHLLLASPEISYPDSISVKVLMMTSMWNNPIILYNTAELYDLQWPILNILIPLEMDIYMIEYQHQCSPDMLDYINNRKGNYKCIQIQTEMKHGALRFATILENCTGKKIKFFCPVCGHQLFQNSN